MRRRDIAAIFLPVTLAACGSQISQPDRKQAAPTQQVDSRKFWFDPLTGDALEDDAAPIGPQGTVLRHCQFEIAYAHLSDTIANAVTVNGTGSCPATSVPFYLTATMTLEKQGFWFWSWLPKATGQPATKLVSTAGAKWYNKDIHAYTTCEPGTYRGRLSFSVSYPGGSGTALPLLKAVGWATDVTC